MNIPLFPIPLLGAGTADVESFPSYLHRTAVAHGVYVGELLRHVDRTIRPCIDCEGAAGLPELPRYSWVHELVRPNRTTALLVQLMEKGTGQALKQSTFWYMDGVLGRSSDEVVKTFRWCPECIREMLLTGQPTHFKLSWHLSGITECPIHGSPFLTHCPYCGENQGSYVRSQPLHICSSCGGNLGVRRTSLRKEQIVSSWQRQGKDLVRLMKDLAEMESLEFPHDGVRKSLNLIFGYYWENDRENELYEILGRDPLIGLLGTDRPISLIVARRFAYQLGLTLHELMSGHAHQTSAILDSKWVCPFQPEFMDKKHKRKTNHLAVLRKIRTLLAECEAPPPLCKVAQQVGVSVGYLEYRFPVLVRQIVDEHQKFVQQQRRRTVQRAQSLAMKFFFEEQYNPELKSRKEAYRVLRRKTGLPKFVLRQAIQEAYMTLNG